MPDQSRHPHSRDPRDQSHRKGHGDKNEPAKPTAPTPSTAVQSCDPGTGKRRFKPLRTL